MELFNQGQGMQPMMLWVKMDSRDDMNVSAAGQVAEQGAINRLFKEGVAQDLMPLMVTDLLNNAQVPDEFGGGGIGAVVVAGEMSIRAGSGENANLKDGLGIWVHSLDRTELACLPVTTDGGKRTCIWKEMMLSDSGRTGRLTMRP
jgi:hypothetical protein